MSPRLYLISDRHVMAGDPAEVMGRAAAAGVPALQLRERDLTTRELMALAHRVRERLEGTSSSLFINDRADVAAAVGAAGVHLRGSSMGPDAVRRVFPELLTGVSVHSVDEALDAARRGASFLLFGPVYDTPSKRSYGPPQGLEALERVVRAVETPVLAVGGITPERVGEVMARGVAGVAAIRAAWDRPEEMIPRFLEELRCIEGG